MDDGKIHGIKVGGVEVLFTDMPTEAGAGHAVGSGEQKLKPRGQTMHIGGGENQQASWRKDAADFIKNRRVRRQVFEDFGGQDDIKTRIGKRKRLG